VDGLERELKERVQVVRLDVMSTVGQQTARHYKVSGLPTFLLFDGQGQMVYRQAGLINRERVREIITELESKESK
jgi:thioredoxin-related protein